MHCYHCWKRLKVVFRWSILLFWWRILLFWWGNHLFFGGILLENLFYFVGVVFVLIFAGVNSLSEVCQLTKRLVFGTFILLLNWARHEKRWCDFWLECQWGGDWAFVAAIIKGLLEGTRFFTTKLNRVCVIFLPVWLLRLIMFWIQQGLDFLQLVHKCFTMIFEMVSHDEILTLEAFMGLSGSLGLQI